METGSENDQTTVRVQALQNSSTELTLRDRKGTLYEVSVVVEDDVSNLSQVAAALYPDLTLTFYPVQGSVLVRGHVDSVRQRDQIVELAEQYYPTVLNQLTMGPVSRHQGGKDSSGMIRRASLGDVQSADVDVIRPDIRTLHGEVRELLNLLRRQENGPTTEARAQCLCKV